MDELSMRSAQVVGVVEFRASVVGSSKTESLEILRLCWIQFSWRCVSSYLGAPKQFAPYSVIDWVLRAIVLVEQRRAVLSVSRFFNQPRRSFCVLERRCCLGRLRLLPSLLITVHGLNQVMFTSWAYLLYATLKFVTQFCYFSELLFRAHLGMAYWAQRSSFPRLWVTGLNIEFEFHGNSSFPWGF